nr:autotransporter assembly complex family protein [Mesorhizobium sp. NBSH29]
MRYLLLLAGVIMLGASVAAPAHAFELFGLKIFGRDKPDPAEDVIGDPQNYTMEFIVTGDEGDVETLLKGSSSLWKDREKPASGAAGLLNAARSDYRRLLATLYGLGRYGGSISILVDGREASDLPPDSELGENALISVTVSPGPEFFFDKASIINRAPTPTERRDVVDLPEDEGFAPGKVARSGVIIKAEKLSVEAWRQQGFAKASVVDRRVAAAHDSNTVDAEIEISPGQKASYGDVTVVGTERMNPAYVAWMTGLKPGQEYDPDDIERANKRLSKLDVFRALRIQEADAIGADGLLPLTVSVQERKPRRFGVGGSYSTLDGVGLEAYWMHRNLFGRAERLRFDAKVAGIGDTFKPDALTYRAGVSFIRPGVFTPDTDFEASVFGDREVLDPYTRTAVTGLIGFNHLFSEELSAKAFVQGGYAQFEDDTFGTRDFMYAGLLGGLTFDNRDNKVDATNGVFLDAGAEPFYEFNYGNFIGKFTGEGRAYYGFGAENPVVLAGRLKLGTLFGAPISEVAPDKLFFAGGGGSVRGYAYRNIGVDTEAGEVIGGRSLIEGSAEIRARVSKSIGLVGFVDAGYVGADTIPGFSEDLRIGAGAGLRYYTALGPIRLDVAVPLDPRPADPSVAFYVGIGQAF